MIIRCSVCDHELNIYTQTTVAKVVTWVEYKNDRFVGQIIKPSAPVGYAHKVCIEGQSIHDGAPQLF